MVGIVLKHFTHSDHGQDLWITFVM